MRIIYNKYFPFGPFFAINILGVIFARKDRGKLSATDENHEHIHTLQQQEMLYILFFLWYITEWLILLIKYRNLLKAYRNIRFEKEAYCFQYDLDYEKHRKHYAWFVL